MDKNVEENIEQPTSEIDHKVPAEVEEILKLIPEDKRELLLKSLKFEIKQEITESYFSGPLPHPEILERYNELIPNGADRITKLAENQNAHRISTETKLVDQGLIQSKRGQIFAFILGISGFVSATKLGITGHYWLAGIIGGSTVTSLVLAFIYGKYKPQQNKELNNITTTDKN